MSVAYFPLYHDMFPFLTDRNLSLTMMVLSKLLLRVVSLFMVIKCEGAFMSSLVF